MSGAAQATSVSGIPKEVAASQTGEQTSGTQ